MEYIELNGRSSWKDFNLIMIGREVNPADVKRAVQELPQTHGVIDFSRGRNNEIYFYERPLSFKFYRIIPSRSARELLRYRVMQWVNQFTDGILRDSVEPHFYYKNVTCVNCFFSDMKSNRFEVTIDFLAYPFRQSNEFEGDKIYDTIDWELDIIQNTVVGLPPMEEQLPYKELKVGDLITLGGWSQFKAGDNGRLSTYEQEKMYTIKAITDDGIIDHSKYIYSGVKYQIEEDNSWVRVQDVVQARTNPVELKLYNSGSSTVFPELKIRNTHVTLSGITVEHEGNFYNFKRGDYNDKFPLHIGENQLKVYGQGLEVDFQFRKEVH